MNKCLVTTLKAQTNNEALSKYNVLTIKIKASDSPALDKQWFAIGTAPNGGVSINSQSVGLYKSGISGELLSYPIIVPRSTAFGHAFENKDGIIELTGKYKLVNLRVGANATLRIKEIYGMLGTIEILSIHDIEESEIDATKLCNTFSASNFRSFNIINPTRMPKIVNKLDGSAVGNFVKLEEVDYGITALFDSLSIDDLANNVNIKQLSPWGGLKAGHCSSLAKLTKLERLIFINEIQNNGDIMDFINPWIQAGRTSGKFNVVGLLSQKNITLNGRSITYPSGVTNANAYLNWTSDGTVTFTAS